MAIKSVKIRLLKRLLQAGSDSQVINALEKIHPADISILFSEIADADLKRLMEGLLKTRQAGRVLCEIPEYFLPEILDAVESDKLADILGRSSSDDAVYVMRRIPERRWPAILELMPVQRRIELERFLTYPAGSAGIAMNSDFFGISLNATIEEAIADLRRHPDKGGVFYVYVLDDRRLVGVLPLRILVTAEPNQFVRELMTTDVVTVLASDSQEKAARIVNEYNLLAIPVVNENETLLGVITVDDVIEIVQREATEDIYNIAGLSEEDRAFTPVRVKVKKRLPWALVNLFTAFIASSVVGLFQDTITHFAMLAAYMPVVAGMGGNGGTQSLVVMTRSLALGEIKFSKAYPAVWREVLNALVVGIVVGTLASLVCYFISHDIRLGIVLFMAMVLNLVLAGFVGSIVPLTLRALRLDPAVGSSILLTMVTDTTGFFVFLSLAKMVLVKN